MGEIGKEEEEEEYKGKEEEREADATKMMFKRTVGCDPWGEEPILILLSIYTRLVLLQYPV